MRFPRLNGAAAEPAANAALILSTSPCALRCPAGDAAATPTPAPPPPAVDSSCSAGLPTATDDQLIALEPLATPPSTPKSALTAALLKQSSADLAAEAAVRFPAAGCWGAPRAWLCPAHARHALVSGAAVQQLLGCARDAGRLQAAPACRHLHPLLQRRSPACRRPLPRPSLPLPCRRWPKRWLRRWRPSRRLRLPSSTWHRRRLPLLHPPPRDRRRQPTAAQLQHAGRPQRRSRNESDAPSPENEYLLPCPFSCDALPPALCSTRRAAAHAAAPWPAAPSLAPPSMPQF